MFLVYVALLLMRIVYVFKDLSQQIYFSWNILKVLLKIILLICLLTLCFLLPILPSRHAVGETFFVQDCNILFHDLLVSNFICFSIWYSTFSRYFCVLQLQMDLFWIQTSLLLLFIFDICHQCSLVKRLKNILLGGFAFLRLKNKVIFIFWSYRNTWVKSKAMIWIL